MLRAFPCGRTYNVRLLRPSIASAINSQVQMHAFFSFCNESYHSRLGWG